MSQGTKVKMLVSISRLATKKKGMKYTYSATAVHCFHVGVRRLAGSATA